MKQVSAVSSAGAVNTFVDGDLGEVQVGQTDEQPDGGSLRLSGLRVGSTLDGVSQPGKGDGPLNQ